MDEIVSWLDDRPSGSQTLTPDWWVFDKNPDGTWAFHFFPEITVSPAELAAHGRPEPVDPAKWHGKAGCAPDCPPGVFAYADPCKELERHAFNDPNGFLHGRKIDQTVRVAAFPEDPVWSGREFSVEWAVYAGPVAFSWNGYARVPSRTHPWWGLDYDDIPAGDPFTSPLSYGCDREGWIGFDTLDETATNTLMLVDPEHQSRLRELYRQLGGPEPESRQLTCDEVADRARDLALAVYKKEHGANIPGFQPPVMD